MGNPGFAFMLPAEFHDATMHTIYAYAIDSGGGVNPLLGGSPFAFTVP
jgi:hypothetical protein